MSLHRNLTETTSPNEGEHSLWGACVIGSAAPPSQEGSLGEHEVHADAPGRMVSVQITI